MVHHFAVIIMKFQNIDSLLQRIKKFNEIFLLDCENDSQDKKWFDYLDPISLKLFNKTYYQFISENCLEFPNPPGELEKYFNIFKTIESDFKNLSILQVPNEIYCSACDVLEIFEDFLSANNFSVENERILVNGYFIYSYKIFPLI